MGIDLLGEAVSVHEDKRANFWRPLDPTAQLRMIIAWEKLELISVMRGCTKLPTVHEGAMPLSTTLLRNDEDLVASHLTSPGSHSTLLAMIHECSVDMAG
jgi:hypothetical protein